MCRESGFTLIEILIVMAIGVILALGGFLGMSGYRDRKNLEFSLNEVAAVVRETRDRSITQENGYRWGMRFMSSSTGFDTYKVFKGATYANGTTTATYSFRRAVEFSEPSNDRYADLLFEAVSGKIDNRKIISLVLKKGGSRAGDIIVNTAGLVTQRMEDDIVGYWHLDEGTGTSAYDASGNDNTGTVNGATWQSGSSCKAGECLSFNGTNTNYVNFGNIFNEAGIKNTMTVEAWFNTDTLSQPDGGIGMIVSKAQYSVDNTAWTIYVNSAGVNWNIRDDDNTSYTQTVSFGLNTWNHVVGTWDNGAQKMYLNGISVASTTRAFTKINDSTSNVYIGLADNTVNHWFKGQVDEVRIYDRALTATEISAHYDDLK